MATIRRAAPADALLILSISHEAYTAAYLATIGGVPKPATEDYGPRIERGEVCVLADAGRPAGVLVLEVKPAHLFVYSVAIRPEHQGKGHGAALLAFAEQHARASGLPALQLHTNQRMTRNIALYRRSGFVQIDSRAHHRLTGEVLIDMEKG